jgi:hypothetical protein
MGDREQLRRRVVGLCVVIALCPPFLHAQNRQTPSLVVRLPQTVNPETTVIQVEKKGQPSFFQEIRTEKGIYEYPIPFQFGNAPSAFQANRFTSLRLTIYIPGFRSSTIEFVPADLATPRVYEPPPLVKLPTVHFEGILVDSGNSPIGGQAMSLTYNSVPNGCVDCILSPRKIVGTSTQPDGKFQFEIPVLSGDPFFGNADFGFFSLSAGTGYLNPSTFKMQPAFSTPWVVTRKLPGKLVGKIGEGFFQKNQLPAELSKFHDYDTKNYVDLQIDYDRGRYSRPTEDDGSFEIGLAPNKYSLSIRIVRGTRKDVIKILDDILIEENKSTIIQIP